MSNSSLTYKISQQGMSQTFDYILATRLMYCKYETVIKQCLAYKIRSKNEDGFEVIDCTRRPGNDIDAYYDSIISRVALVLMRRDAMVWGLLLKGTIESLKQYIERFDDTRLKILIYGPLRTHLLSFVGYTGNITKSEYEMMVNSLSSK
jgi:hypothetical protein